MKTNYNIQKATKIFASGGTMVLLLMSSNNAFASVTCYYDYNTPYYGSHTTGQSTCYDNSAIYKAQAQNEILGAVLKVYAAAEKSKQQLANQKAADDYQQYLVQHTTEKVNDRFKEVFGREPNNAEFFYWFNRVQKENLSHAQVKEKMTFYKATGKTISAPSVQPTSGASKSALASKINAIFRAVYGRDPSVSENQYWVSRIKDKPTEQEIQNTMLFHKLNGINH
ncbi:MAG: hypothetical protein ABIP54_01185 [Candidatus Andersenbacteria bacterium]